MRGLNLRQIEAFRAVAREFIQELRRRVGDFLRRR